MDEKPLSESHATSREPGSCRETGEELFGKHPFPLGDQMEQLPRSGAAIAHAADCGTFAAPRPRQSGGRWRRGNAPGSIGDPRPARRIAPPTKSARTRSCCGAGPVLPWRTTPAAADSRSLAFPGWPSHGRTARRSPGSCRQGAGGSGRRSAYRGVRKLGVIGKDVTALPASPAGQPDGHAQDRVLHEQSQPAAAQLMGCETAALSATAAQLVGNRHDRHSADARLGCALRLRLQLSGGAVRY